MEGILHTFGIDGRLIVIQIFNFVLLLAALWYFLYTPVLNMLKEREGKIAKGVKDAEEAAQAKETAEAHKKQVLSEAQAQAESITAQAKEHADVRGREIVAEAESKAATTIKDGEVKAGELKAQALKESEAEIAKLAVLAAEKVIKEQS